MSHREYVKTAREMARGWGKDFDSQEAAVRDMAKAGVDVAAASLLELVRRLNVVIDALSRDGQDFDRREQDDKSESKPGNVGIFPGVKVGDSLYHCEELECGVCRYLVIAADQETPGHCRVVPTDLTDYQRYDRPRWGADFMSRTPEEALKKQAESDVRYYGSRLEAARTVLDTINRGGDVTPFLDGVDDDDD